MAADSKICRWLLCNILFIFVLLFSNSSKAFNESDLTAVIDMIQSSDSDMEIGRFVGADLSESNLGGLYLYGIDLSGADLTKANLSSADLSKANLSRAILFEADLHEAVMLDSFLNYSDLSSTNIVSGVIGFT